MSRFPSGVTVMTARSGDGTYRGFTASAFCSVSLRPPLVLVCLADAAECYDTFRTAHAWSVHILSDHQADLALRFATKGIPKFSAADFEEIDAGQLALPDAVASLFCRAYERYPGGDHLILVGEVIGVRLGEAEPLVHYDRAFPRLVT